MQKGLDSNNSETKIKSKKVLTYTVKLARAKLPAKAAGKLIRRQKSPQVPIACGFCA